MNDCIVPVISDLDGRHAHIIQQRLPLPFSDVGRAVHKASIDKDHNVIASRLGCQLSDFYETVFESYLEFHEASLEH